MPASGWGATAEGDQADFAARANLPGRGLPYAGMENLGVIEVMRRERLEPPEWAERLKSLRSLLPAPTIGEQSSREQVDAWRSTAAAMRAFDQALEQAAAVFPPAGKLALAEFWKQVETALALEPLRIPGNRREAVHILDVFEARQWELPVVFVCGLLERHFPAYHGEDPVLGEALRRKLGLITAEQRNTEERFLFNLATSRATEEVVLSYSRFDEKGDKTLPSFFLEGAAGKPCEGHVQPQPERTMDAPESGPIQAPALLRDLAKLHRKISPSGVESFLQCPFQFFAAKTLRVKERPPAPRDRLNFLVKGNIVHKALAEWTTMPLLRGDILNRVFEDECARLRIPRTYRTEAARLELLRHFEAFLEEGRLALGWRTEAEVQFELPISPELTIRGRIDRLDIGPENQALVIDYKYSAAQKVRERVKASDAGELVQAGAYLLAAEQVLKLNPVGMLYCGLKKEIVWEGWHVPLQGLEDKGTVGTAESLREQMEATLAKISESHQAIVSGRLEVKPTDDDKCRYCDFRDACRVEGRERAVQIGAAP